MRVGTKLADVAKRYRAQLDEVVSAGEDLPVLDAVISVDAMKVLQRKASDVIKRELEALPELIEDAQDAIDSLVGALDLLGALAEGEIALDKIEDQKPPSVFSSRRHGPDDGDGDGDAAVPAGDGLLSPDRGLATSGGGEV